MYTSPKFESKEAARSQVKMDSDGYQGMRSVVQNGAWTSFVKGLAAAQTLHPVTAIATGFKP